MIWSILSFICFIAVLLFIGVYIFSLIICIVKKGEGAACWLISIKEKFNESKILSENENTEIGHVEKCNWKRKCILDSFLKEKGFSSYILINDNFVITSKEGNTEKYFLLMDDEKVVSFILAEKPFDKEKDSNKNEESLHYYRDVISGCTWYHQQIHNTLLEEGECTFDAKTINNGKRLSKANMRKVIDALRDFDYRIISVDFEESTAIVGLKQECFL